MSRRLIHIYTFLCACALSYGQHFQFSQFYAAPIYLNPAFTGANVCSRLSLNYRKQWAGIPGSFTSYQASFDHYLPRIKSGLGLVFFSDVAGPGSLKTTQVSLLYAYEARVNKKVMTRAGLSAGSVQRSVNYSAFTFGDQIARGSSSSMEATTVNGTRYFDVSTGILVYTAEAWGGITASHLNRANQSLLNTSSPLPTEFKFHGGYKFNLENKETTDKKNSLVDAITVAFNLKNQRKFNQLDLGAYYTKSSIVFGIWYRGIPISKPNGQDINTDAVIFLIGLTIERFKVGYSYDLTVSKLTNSASKGAHELSMSYQLCNGKKTNLSRKKKYPLINCPKF